MRKCMLNLHNEASLVEIFGRINLLLVKIMKVGQSEKQKFWGVGLNFYMQRA